MLVTCKACRKCKEMRVGKKRSVYLLMKSELRNSFLGSAPELCCECLRELLDWIHSKQVESKAAA